jgi:hypothetical protein
MQKRIPEFENMYIGLKSGKVISYPIQEAMTSNELYSQPWYSQVMSTGTAYIGKPIVDTLTGNILIVIAKSIVDYSRNSIGVAA